jgi:hypothetical protein
VNLTPSSFSHSLPPCCFLFPHVDLLSDASGFCEELDYVLFAAAAVFIEFVVAYAFHECMCC